MIEEYLSQKALVQNVSTIDELGDLVNRKDSINIMMGQTFDAGQPVDMMKYALVIMHLTDLLKGIAISVNSNWLIADHFIADINQDQAVAEVKRQADQRIEYLTKLNEVYGGEINFVRSSELSKTNEYAANLELLFKEAEKNPRFKELVLNSIPPDRRNNPNALRYPFEELATIQTMYTDIKIGPPYEILYDAPAREFAAEVGFTKYVSVQLTRSFPLGNPEISPKLMDEIETFGLLPYKINSKGLGDYRIDVINGDPNKTAALILNTRDPRALIDLIVISEQARLRFEQKSGISFMAQKGLDMQRPDVSQNFGIGRLKDLAYGSHFEFIHKLMHQDLFKPD